MTYEKKMIRSNHLPFLIYIFPYHTFCVCYYILISSKLTGVGQDGTSLGSHKYLKHITFSVCHNTFCLCLTFCQEKKPICVLPRVPSK